MPVVTVHVVLDDPARPLPRGAPRRLADAAGEVFASRPGGTWVRLFELPRDRYAESGTAFAPELRPTFVEVLLADLPAEDELAERAARLAERVAEVLERPLENTHVLFLPEARGRVAFGGRLLRGSD